MEGNNKNKKLDTATWVLLATGAGIVDATQAALTPTVVGAVVSAGLDIFTGIVLLTIFIFNGIKDKKVMFSVVGGLTLGLFSLGILPTWIADVGYAWFVTDGAKTIGNVPVIGEAAEKAVELSKKVGGEIPKS